MVYALALHTHTQLEGLVVWDNAGSMHTVHKVNPCGCIVLVPLLYLRPGG